jgi:hypothetical protein
MKTLVENIAKNRPFSGQQLNREILFDDESTGVSAVTAIPQLQDG